jgi:CheY-like chemotaxis protein
MEKNLKILLTASKGFLYNQATKAFAKGDYKITTVARASVESVIERVGREKPDVILLDVSMPSLSGKSVVALIRQESPDTIVIVEMKAMQLSRSMNLVRSADAVVVEPYEPAELRMRVDTAVATRARPARPPLVAELHDPATGRVNAKKLADYLGIPLVSLANAIGKDYKAVFKTPASEPLQSALAPIHRTVVALHRYFGRREESLAWLNTVNPELDAKRPKDLVLEGKAEIVADMLEGALAGVTA